VAGKINVYERVLTRGELSCRIRLIIKRKMFNLKDKFCLTPTYEDNKRGEGGNKFCCRKKFMFTKLDEEADNQK